jgi:hypothetical protein
LPAVAPIQDEELEAEGINLDSRLKADTEVVVVHLVELGARVQKADVASDREEQVVVERRQFGELILEQLGCSLGTLTFSLDLSLDLLRKDLVGQLSQPALEKRADHVGIVEIWIADQINVSI